VTDILERLRYLREHELRDYEDTMAAYEEAADEIERLRGMMLHPDWNVVVSEIANYRRENAHKVAVAGMNDVPVDRAFLDRRLDSIDWGKGQNNRVRSNIDRAVWNDKTNDFDYFSPVTVRELIAIPEYQMLRCPNVGHKTVEHIKSKLAEHGLYLGMQI
jgi:hypothetical protein